MLTPQKAGPCTPIHRCTPVQHLACDRGLKHPERVRRAATGPDPQIRAFFDYTAPHSPDSPTHPKGPGLGELRL